MWGEGTGRRGFLILAPFTIRELLQFHLFEASEMYFTARLGGKAPL